MADGSWLMADGCMTCPLPISIAISHQPSAISHQPSAISHQPSAISHSHQP
jgi:hypothetical protein